MKKHVLEKLVEPYTDAVVKLDEDEGTYFVSFPGYDIVALSMREKIGDKERFVDKWAIYVHADYRNSIYMSLHDDLDDALKQFKTAV
jgi:hypothetical protein